MFFLSSCELSSSPLKRWAPTPFLSSGWHISFNCLTCPWVSFFWGPCMYLIKISSVNLLYVNLIIRPAEEPRGTDVKLFLPYSQTSSHVCGCVCCLCYSRKGFSLYLFLLEFSVLGRCSLPPPGTVFCCSCALIPEQMLFSFSLRWNNLLCG